MKNMYDSSQEVLPREVLEWMCEQVKLNALMRRWTVAKTRQFCRTVEQVCKLWRTKTGSHTLFLVCTKKKNVTHLNKLKIGWTRLQNTCIFQSQLSKMSEPFPERKLEKQMYTVFSRIVQCISTRLVPEYCWWPVDSNDTNIARTASDDTAKIVKYHYFLPRELLIYSPSRRPAVPQSAQTSSGDHNRLWNERVLGHRTDVEMSPRTSSGKVQALLPEMKTNLFDYQFNYSDG